MAIKKPLEIKQPNVGNFIRELRNESGLTQEKFAALLGVTYPTISRWENGRAKPSPLAMEKLERQVKRIGQRGQDLLEQYFSN
ncbi:MAG: helix-turn-helix transcriptional regulator [Symploca sp. SIO3C6]|uniref:Helix-turn-helix transcriptional regulator n=1 Tax=Symploca sp. SIO1C4 TaxID=2607765 RepID=A0A6B3NFY7_9CYAN|nr:helix-turn-helix transcriptional regulator [Symploca sp. SIO3C6]NER32059.1 helix-turn-helix transcriptional regulator [Symploca sp. SIO1C4]NET03977.1 helix-turn-helix transcriptional regulator [Symploca sp. SIO2B6]